jgi:predicted Zn-dependent protease
LAKKFTVLVQVGVMLPYSRNHETEADKIGLILMAIAGYNPDQAISGLNG